MPFPGQLAITHYRVPCTIVQTLHNIAVINQTCGKSPPGVIAKYNRNQKNLGYALPLTFFRSLIDHTLCHTHTVIASTYYIFRCSGAAAVVCCVAASGQRSVGGGAGDHAAAAHPRTHRHRGDVLPRP